MWAKARYELHRQMYPPEEKAARQREATARYRKAHAKRIELARTVPNILMRQRWYPHDAKTLAAAIIGLVGKDCAKDLCTEIRAAARPDQNPSRVRAPSHRRRS
jgi:hypothetical protein